MGFAGYRVLMVRGQDNYWPTLADHSMNTSPRIAIKGKGFRSLDLFNISLYILNLSPLLFLKPFEKLLVVVIGLVVVTNDFIGQPKPKLKFFSKEPVY